MYDQTLTYKPYIIVILVASVELLPDIPQAVRTPIKVGTDKLTVGDSTSQLCQSCCELFKQLRATGDMEERMRRVCKLLGNPIEVRLCKKEVRKYVKRLATSTPDQVCQTLQMC